MRSSILYEMHIRYQGNDNKSMMLIAHRNNIWLLDNEVSPDVLRDISDQLGLDIEVDDDSHFEDFDLSSELEDRADVLHGWYTPNKKSLYLNMGVTQNPYTSILVKKVSQQLGIDEIVQSNLNSDGSEVDYSIFRHEMAGKIPQTLYHGTSTTFAHNIIKKGLMPSDNKNWEIKFNDLIFVCANPRYAQFHADRTATNTKGFPVVFEVKIPDRTKLVMDYDIAVQFYGYDHPEVLKLGYNQRLTREHPSLEIIRQINRKTDLNTQIGIFGYKGRIPASHITSIYANFSEDSSDLVDWHAFENREDFQEALQIANAYGYWEPGMDFDEEEDEY